jgi:protein import protein ZIM17
MTEVLVRACGHADQSHSKALRIPVAAICVATTLNPSLTMNATTAIRSLTRASQQSLRNHIGLQRTWPAPSASLLRKPLQTSQTPLQRLGVRCHSTESSGTRAPRPLTDRDSIPEEKVLSDKDAIAARKALQPCYDMTFTCKKCLDRSSHRITKQAYHFGTVLINCPGCKSRHLIADHMKVCDARILARTGDLVLTSLDRFSQTKASLSKTF